jgi:hypothetical protein
MGTMTGYRERLVPGIGTLLACLLVAPATLVVFLPISLPVGIAAAIALTALIEVLLIGLAPVVQVADGRLVAGAAHIEVGLTGTPEAFRGADATAARGVGLDARAWTLLRGWVDPVVRVPITDPEDPAPYWVVSTRHPERLMEALAAARRASAARP